MAQELKASAAKVQDSLKAMGLEAMVVQLPASTRTAKEAAEAVGCQVAQIAKSIVFRGLESDRPVLVVASGINRIDEAKVSDLLGEPIGPAQADYVRARTGFVIGGVPPLGHQEEIWTVVDRDLLGFDLVWAAAGTPKAVFSVSPADLVRAVGGRVAQVAA